MKRLIIVLAVAAMCMFFMLGSTVMAQDFCLGNTDYDGDVDGSDAARFKQHFGRKDCPPDGPAPVERTWQSIVHETYDDGWYQKGVAWGTRFTDNGNGTIKDNLTGLIWLQDANCWGMLTWSQALIYSSGLVNGQCGLTDGSIAGAWRLPNVKEMASLIDYDYGGPAMHMSYFFNKVQSNVYWSSTTYAYIYDYAWNVGMLDGDVDVANKNYDLGYVWPVRGGHPY